MVCRIPTPGFGAHGLTPAGAGKIASSPVMGDLYQRQLDRFVAESPQALAFARQSLPGHSLSRIESNYLNPTHLNLTQVRAELANTRVAIQAASWQAKLVSGAIVGSLVLTPLVASGLLYPMAIGLAVNAASVAIAVAFVVAFAVVAGGVFLVIDKLLDSELTGLALGYLGVVFGSGFVVGTAIAAVLFAHKTAGAAGIAALCASVAAGCGAPKLYSYLVGTCPRRELRKFDSFLNDPTSREAFFQAHPGEFIRFLKESVSGCFRAEQAGVRQTMDKLEAKMEEIQSKTTAEMRKIDDSTIPDLEKEGLKETVLGVETRALKELGEAHARQKALSEAIDQFMDEVNTMQAAVEGEMTRGDAYQGVAAFQRRVEEEVPGLVEAADESLERRVIDLHVYLEQLKEAADRLQGLMAAELQVDQLLELAPGPFEFDRPKAAKK